MKFQLEPAAGGNTILGYAEGHITLNQTVVRRSTVITPERLIEDWPPQRFEDFAVPHFEVLAALDVEVVLLGTGARLRFPATHLLTPLLSRGIGIEVMDTAAACRTYNVLVGEGRQVAAALLMI